MFCPFAMHVLFTVTTTKLRCTAVDEKGCENVLSNGVWVCSHRLLTNLFSEVGAAFITG